MYKLAVREVRTPVGPVRIYIMGIFPVRVTLGEEGPAIAPYALRPPSLVSEMEGAIADYFSGGDISRELALRLLEIDPHTPFEYAVYRRVIDIPRGETLSYGEVAEAVGRPRAARAVGNAMRSNLYPLFIPCHRVIRSGGGLGGFGGREEIKAALLRTEGIVVEP
ncbi:MAG: MGMT family protein [Actinobacteria bacterium]|nr:MGMT family protein [Actinomycetota bacterium]